MLKRFTPLALLLLLMAVCAPVFAQTDEAIAQQMYRPTAMPDRVVLTWTDAPHTSQTVTWRTAPEAGDAVAQILKAEPGPYFEERATTVKATTRSLETKLWKASYHTARFVDLEPDTSYIYRVGDGKNWSEWLQFKTALAKPAPFSFLYFGDVQHGIRTLWPRVLRQAYKDAPDVRFMLFAGDIVTDGTNDIQWGELFQAGSWLFGMVPVVPSPGNHEYRKDESGKNSLTRHWAAQFAAPRNGPKGILESAFYVDYQGLRVICLNSNEPADQQAAWLDEILAKNPNRWTVAVFHHPLYSLSKGRNDNQKLISLWKPIFDKRGVDLVLTGHDHTYARSGLQEKTVYATSVSGSKMYDLERKPWMQRVAEDTQLYQIIKIDGDKLVYESRTATGSLYDAFELRKVRNSVRFSDKRPRDVPELLRPKAAKEN